MRVLYNILLHTVVAPCLFMAYAPKVLLKGKYRNSIGGKLGRLPEDFPTDELASPLIWFHAVSVGESVALNPLVKAVKEVLPKSSIVVSTGTETGQHKARELMPEADGFLYMPIDFPEFVNPVIRTVKPDAFVLMETELWPNLIYGLKQSGSKIMLANGRISDRSFPRYKRLKPLFAPTLRQIDLFSMCSETDAYRIREMGAPSDRVTVSGNTKYDAAPGSMSSSCEREMREILQLGSSESVFVAGSVHPGEFEVILDAYTFLRESHPDLTLVLVPRHIERTPDILSAIKERNLPAPYLRSSADDGARRGGNPIIVVDKTGELFRVYSLASVVFVGGSLVPRGGQNIVEPASWGKMVLFGPSMEDFREARDMLLACGGAIEVTNAEEIALHAGKILANAEVAAAKGAIGRKAMVDQVGSAGRNAELIRGLLGGRK